MKHEPITDFNIHLIYQFKKSNIGVSFVQTISLYMAAKDDDDSHDSKTKETSIME